MSDAALSYVREAIAGDIDAVVPYPALFGAHIVLSNYYGFSNEAASRQMQNFMDAKCIHWYRDMPDHIAEGGFSLAGDRNHRRMGRILRAGRSRRGSRDDSHPRRRLR